MRRERALMSDVSYTPIRLPWRMTQHLFILTGASRGMGLAMAEQLLSANHTLLCISRHANPALQASAAGAGCTLTQWPHDLSDSIHTASALTTWLGRLNGPDWHTATLINNAGVMAPIAPLRDSNPEALVRTLRVGLEAPMALTAAFLNATAMWPAQRKVLNISSGLGRRAMASQAAYCAAKAGLDHFTRCLALDEAGQPGGARVCSLAPGVIDTDMQKQLRSADAAAFPDRASFQQLKDSHHLSSPHDAAARVLAYLARDDFGREPVADVRHQG